MKIGAIGGRTAHSLIISLVCAAPFCAISLNACDSLVFWNPASFAVVVLFVIHREFLLMARIFNRNTGRDAPN